MAVKRKQSLVWSRLHFLVRFLGLSGILIAGVGLTLTLAYGALSYELIQHTWQTWQNAGQTGLGSVSQGFVFVSLLMGGLLLALIALVVEQLVVLRYAAGRGNVVWLNSRLQCLLALVLVVGVNLYSFEHYTRFDLTRHQQFTLPADVQEKLRQLQGETTIVVYLPHQSLGQAHETLKANDRRYISAAERKVIDKLRDLVDEFREFGPQFRVHVLDVNDEHFDQELDTVTKDRPELRAAIERAPENTIFFTAAGKVQRLGFNEVLLLDKEASFKDNEGKGNLVLLDQGVDPLVNKILTIEQKKPKIGIAVVHELLTSQGDEETPYTMAGLRKALTARGFEVKDVLLKRWSEFAPEPEPAVYTYDENKLDRLEERIKILDSYVANNTKAVEAMQKELTYWRTASLEDLTKKYAAELRGRKLTEAMRKTQVQDFEEELTFAQATVADQKRRRDELQAKKGDLNVDALAEQRRLQDLQAKLANTLADCDLLIVPRMTLRDVSRGSNIPNWLHHLDEAQVNAVRDFLKQGKPILCCFGPTNEQPGRGGAPNRSGPDGLETLLAQLGVKFVKKTVLFDAESESFGSSRENLFATLDTIEVPPVEFDWKPGAGRLLRASTTEEEGTPHPIRQSMRLTARSMGSDEKGKNLLLDLRLRHPQPVYFEPTTDTNKAWDAEFIMTSPAAWDEDNPFPTGERTPQPPKKRQSPYPIGVAFETKLPVSWYADKDANRATVRAAVIGHGNLFNGAKLSPGTETLLLDSCNWLLGRDQELTQKEDAWKYPRVQLSLEEAKLWQWAAWLWPPALFAYLGVSVVLLRRLR